jgi:hypothetical protein
MYGNESEKMGIKMTALSVEIVCADKNVIYLEAVRGSPPQIPQTYAQRVIHIISNANGRNIKSINQSN